MVLYIRMLYEGNMAMSTYNLKTILRYTDQALSKSIMLLIIQFCKNTHQ